MPNPLFYNSVLPPIYMLDTNDSRSHEPLKWSGILLIILGLIHIPIWLADGSSWEGSVSWRKPILFGISTGMTLWSLGWLAKNLKRSRLDSTIGWIVSVSLVLEVALITLQRWRGTASHFNHATTIDEVIDFSMLGLICIAFLGICYFGVRCFGKLKLDADYRFALRAGMGFLVVSCLIGFVISIYGYERIAEGLSPEKVGKAGVLKFPHGIAIHALQMLPLAAWVMRRIAIPLPKRVSVVRWLTGSFVLQIVFASYQTIQRLRSRRPANADRNRPRLRYCGYPRRPSNHRCETLAICLKPLKTNGHWI